MLTTIAVVAVLLQDEVILDTNDNKVDENGDHHLKGTLPISPMASGYDTMSSSYPGATAKGPPSR